MKSRVLRYSIAVALALTGAYSPCRSPCAVVKPHLPPATCAIEFTDKGWSFFEFPFKEANRFEAVGPGFLIVVGVRT